MELGPPGPLRDRLVAAVLSGEKTATSALRAQYDAAREPLPVAGQRRPLLGSSGATLATVEVVHVEVIRLGDADRRLAVDEGEGFGSVAEWRAAHEEFWRREVLPGLPGAFTLDDETEVVVERFRLSYGSASDSTGPTRAPQA
jgi:uncharacterized protein YhfF